MSILNFLTIIFKHKRKIILVFIAIVGVVIIRTFTQKPVYEANSSLIVKMLKDDSSRPAMGLGNSNLSLTLSQDEMINTEIQILTGRELAEKVIASIGIEKLYPDMAREAGKKADLMDQAAMAFEKNLKVVGVRKSNVVNINFQNSDPELAAKAVNLLVDAFKEKRLALHSDPQSFFIGTQLAAFQKKLRTSEKNLQEYQQNNNVFSLQEQRSLLLKQRTDFDSAYKLASDTIKELTKKITSIKSQLKYITNNNTLYTHTDRDKIIIDAKGRLLELQLKEQELHRKYTDTNRLVIDAKREVEIVNKFLKEQEEGIIGKVKTGNPVYQNMEIDLLRAEADLNSQMARANSLKTHLLEMDREIAALDMSEGKIQNLKRELEIDEKNYKTYADRNEDARISDAMNQLKLSNISVIEAAVAPVNPIRPKKRLNLLLGVVFGIIGSLSCAFVSEKMAQTFTDPESVERYLDLPVLLTVLSKED
jgi:uncharacterized protein involved in exopolysaccharide biosynthesis